MRDGSVIPKATLLTCLPAMTNLADRQSLHYRIKLFFASAQLAKRVRESLSPPPSVNPFRPVRALNPSHIIFPRFHRGLLSAAPPVLVMTSRVALPERVNGRLLITTMEADPTKAYDQGDATGFIRLNALRLKVAAKVQSKK